MNAPPITSHIRQSIGEAEFALARSRCIDAFARLELRVGLATKRLDMTINRDCLGRRVAALSKAKPCSVLSKANAAKLKEWIDDTEKLLGQRASLVHSEMTIGIFAGELRAGFENCFDIVDDSPMAMLTTLNRLHELAKNVDVLTTRLVELVAGLPPLAKASPNPVAPPYPRSATDPAWGI